MYLLSYAKKKKKKYSIMKIINYTENKENDFFIFQEDLY